MKKFKFKKWLIFPTAFFVVLTLFSFSDPGKRYFEIAKNLEVFASVYSEVNKYYVDEVDPNEFMVKGIEAMLESLDPYTTYISEDKIEDFRFMHTGQYGGIGAMIGTRNNKVTVLMPYLDFPAYKSGLKIGDEIVEISGQNVEGKKTNDISKLLKGQANTVVDIKVRRYGEEEILNFSLTREKIKVKSVPFYDIIDGDVGYIVLTSFTQSATSEITEALKALKDRGAEKFILDLRGNPGGLLKEAILICNLFIEKGKEVVSTRGKIERWNQVHNAPNDPFDLNSRLAILVNGSSASASEIVSGVIQDYDRGVVIGSKTYGKGLVQATFPTAYNSQVKVTTAKYYIPSGRCIQRLDYSSKNENGEALPVPDSLLVPFKTFRGRTVLDGEGITPDIIVETDEAPEVLIALSSANIIFDFATKYYYEKDSIASINDFKVSDNLYSEFLEFVKNKKFSYESRSEKKLLDFKTKLEKDSLSIDLSAEIDAISKKLKSTKENDLMVYKSDIKQELKIELVSRYYLKKGVIKATILEDKEVKSAANILKDEKQYASILKVEE